MAAEPSPEVSARIGAARIVLEAAQGKPTHEQVSAIQRAALEDILGRATLSAQAIAAISELIVQISWHGQDCVHVLRALGSPTGKTPSQRRAQQSWEGVVNYFTATQWETLTQEEHSNEKLDLILSVCGSLGLRCPTEPSLKLIASLWMLTGLAESEVQRSSRNQKGVMYAHVKKEFQKFRKSLADPLEYLNRLSQNPLQLLRDHEQVFKAHFKNSTPIACKIDLPYLHQFDMSYSCRMGGSAKQSTQLDVSPAPQRQGLMMLQDSSPLERVANMFMDRMESIQQTQQQMFQMYISGSAGSSGSLALSSAAEASSRRFQTRRLPTLDLTPQLALAKQVPRIDSPLPAPLAMVASPAGLSSSEGGEQPATPQEAKQFPADAVRKSDDADQGLGCSK